MPSVRPPVDWPQGRVLALAHESRVLRGNPWNDPVARTVHVYLPPGYDESVRHVTLWDLAAFSNSGAGHVGWRNQGENLPQRLDRLIARHALPPVVVVMPDCYTSLGGNQYLNSAAVGRYADYIHLELLPFVAQRVSVFDHRDGRGVFGKSSGGYGALHFAMHWSDYWGAVASHAADIGFEWVYRAAFPEACQVLAQHGGDVQAFLRWFWTAHQPSGREYMTLLTIAMAASYDPDPAVPARIRLPFDLETCTLDAQRWQRWLEHDPLVQVDRAAPALRSLHFLYIDVGRSDQYHTQFGTRLLARRLAELDVDHRFEEFDGTHSGLDWRLDISLPLIAGALKTALGTAN